MLHSGIDPHKRTVVIATVDAAGRRVREAPLPMPRAALTGYFAGLPGGASAQRAVVESTSTWYWLRDLLAKEGIDLRVGHAKHIKAIRDAKVKTDAVDAATLAQPRRQGARADRVLRAHEAGGLQRDLQREAPESHEAADVAPDGQPGRLTGAPLARAGTAPSPMIGRPAGVPPTDLWDRARRS